MSYTKGEWKVERSQGTFNDWIVDSDGKAIALMYTEAGNLKANAHLIAAAPDMYEALQAIRRAFVSGEFENARMLSGTLGHNAIRKAEGKV